LVLAELIAIVESVASKYFDPNDPVDAKNIYEICNFFAQKDIENTDQPVNTSGIEIDLGKKTKAKKSSSKFEYPAPFAGVMSEIVNAATISAYKPQPGLNILAALIGMSACVNGEYSNRNGGRYNLYGVGSLQSGGGKDHPRIVAESVAAIGKAVIVGKPASGAGLEDSLKARKNELVSIDEISSVLHAMNDARAAPHHADIGAVLLKLYSASRSVYHKRLRAVGPHSRDDDSSVDNPCLGMIGFSTPEGLGDAFTDKNFSDGLMGRMLFVSGIPDVPCIRPSNGFDMPESIYQICARMAEISPLAAHAGPLPIGSVVVRETAKISSLLDRLITTMESDRDRSQPLSPSLYARSFEKLERIAGVLSIFDNPEDPVLSEEHIAWAREFVLASDNAALNFANSEMHNNETSKLAAKLRKIINRALAGELSFQRQIEKDAVESGCVSRSQILRVSKSEKRLVDMALAHMQDLGELVAFNQANRALPVIVNIETMDL
jgi:hypothetical protein